MANLGVFGGTFDPPHIGHLILAQSACEQLNLDKIIIIPAGKQPHKSNLNISSGKARLEMLELAIAGDDRFEISDIELGSDDISYTYKTISRLRELYPENELYFLIGGDNISDIETWMKPEEIFGKAVVAAAMRPEYEPSGKFKNDIRLFNMPPIGLSSTEIRDMVKNKRSIKYLVPEKVENYIRKNKLYI